MDDELSTFAQTFRRFMEAMTASADLVTESALFDRLREHLGTDPMSLPVLTERFEPWDHVNVQIGISAYLARDGRSFELVGLSGGARHFEAMSELVHVRGHMAGVGTTAPEFTNLPIGPEETLACVQLGAYLIVDRGARLAVFMRGMSDLGPHPGVNVEVLSADENSARSLLAEVRRLMIERNVFRNQVLSFGSSEMEFAGVGPVVFLRRPEITREQVVLPDRTLDLIEQQVLGVAEAKERLLASGLHIKRGLLLYGPPGNGKTLTIRYILSQARGHTAVVLRGGGMHMLGPACALGRMLQPSIVVLEDVDLVAGERGHFDQEGSGFMLFDLLNEMDGISEDADVTFILTSNRADMLEPALAARPGRIDLAVEIAKPDASARRQLLTLYGRGLDLRLENTDTIVQRTEGVAASFIRELMRKAALRSVGSAHTGRISVNDGHIGGALDELREEQASLTKTLLGAEPDPGRPGVDWLVED